MKVEVPENMASVVLFGVGKVHNSSSFAGLKMAQTSHVVRSFRPKHLNLRVLSPYSLRLRVQVALNPKL